MIKSFKNKQLENFYKNGACEELEGIDYIRLRLVLLQLDAAEEIRDFQVPSLQFTRVKKNGTYSISIGNGKKIVFKLVPTNK